MNLGHLTILHGLFPNQSHPFYCLDDPMHHQGSHWHLGALGRVLPSSQTPVHSLYHLTASSTLSGASYHLSPLSFSPISFTKPLWSGYPSSPYSRTFNFLLGSITFRPAYQAWHMWFPLCIRRLCAPYQMCGVQYNLEFQTVTDKVILSLREVTS